MKTIDNLRLVLPVIFFSTLLLTVADANAQNRWKKDKHENDRNEYRGRNDRGDRNHYNNNRENRDYVYENSYDEGKGYRSEYYGRNRHDPRCYDHPRYGRVYQRFDHNPVVFRHDRDNYYYYGDNFYTYRRGIGYCVAEPPREVYFRTLPVECERVYVNGNILFRHGGLFFQLSPRGYSIVTSPVQVRISARF
jgi:hypothetical protein